MTEQQDKTNDAKKAENTALVRIMPGIGSVGNFGAGFEYLYLNAVIATQENLKRAGLQDQPEEPQINQYYITP